jgi:transposase
VCRLDQARLDRLAQALEQGPAAHGYTEDQRWTLARVADLIARLFHVRYSLRGVSFLLHRIGFSAQVAAHRAVERDEQAIATWRKDAWASGRG